MRFTSSAGSIWVFVVFSSSIEDSEKVWAVAGFPLVVLLDQDRAGQAQQRGGVGEHTDDVGAAFDLLIDPFQRVRRSDLPPVPLRERRER